MASSRSTGRRYMLPKTDRPTRTRLLEVSATSTIGRGVNARIDALFLTWRFHSGK